MCSGGESISFSKLTSISKLSNIVNYGNGQTTRRPMRREPDMRNETNPGADVDICHELSPDDNNTVSSYIYNLSPEVFDFRRRYSFNFLFAHVNINSFRHKYPSVHDMLIKQSVDLLYLNLNLIIVLPIINFKLQIMPFIAVLINIILWKIYVMCMVSRIS